MRAGLDIRALRHAAMRGDPGIRALLVQAGPQETDWGWHGDITGSLESRRVRLIKKKKRNNEGDVEWDDSMEG